MDFIDQIKQLSLRVVKTKDVITTEEATKMSLIIPFFQTLGYDVFNPEEFLPEYTADVGIKKGEKVDYAIMINGKPVILIECKWCGMPLEKHDSQLFRYFGTTPAKFAILTNGIVYKFYTDLDETNKMDLIPFLEIDLLNINENLVSELKKFQKSNFDPDTLVSVASELKYSKAIKEIFNSQLTEPTDEFVRYFASQVYDGQKTQIIIDKFRAIVKNTLNDFISEKMNEKIKSAFNAEIKNDEPKEKQNDIPEISEEPQIINKIVTTEEELESYYAVKSILNGMSDIKKITYKDTESYFNIIYDNKITQWLCRLKFTPQKKLLIFPAVLDLENKKEIRYEIESVNDVYAYSEMLITSIKRFL
jgi:Uncharacterized conserved protein